MATSRDNAADLPAPADDAASEPRAGFDDFVRSQYAHLVGYLRRRTRSAEDAEDIAQESLMRLMRYRESDVAVSWRALLYRIAINVSNDHARSAMHHGNGKHVPIEDCELADAGPLPEERALRQQQLALLRQAVLALPPKCRRVYLLKRKYGLSRMQIAQRCGISVKMVEKHLATALLRLQREVGSGPDQTS